MTWSAEAVPSATIVVVTWSNVGGLERCLDSLDTQSLARSSYRVLVVDNDSRDGSRELLEQRAAVTQSGLSVLRLPRNVGFAGGVAAAFEQVTTPFVVLVNDDAIADRGLVAALLAPFQAGEGHRVAAVTGHVLLTRPLAPARSPRGVRGEGILLDNAGRPFVDDGDVRAGGGALLRINSTGNEVRRDGNAQDRDWLRPVDSRVADPVVFGFCGAAAALRTSAVRDVGGIDATLFLYWEDTDLSWRLRRAGWEIRYAAAAIAHHEHSASSGSGSAVSRFYNERNRLVVLTRYAPGPLVVRTLARYLARTLIWSVRRRPEAAARWRVVASYARRLPADLHRRGRGERTAVRTRRDLATWLVPVPRADSPAR